MLDFLGYYFEKYQSGLFLDKFENFGPLFIPTLVTLSAMQRRSLSHSSLDWLLMRDVLAILFPGKFNSWLLDIVSADNGWIQTVDH